MKQDRATGQIELGRDLVERGRLVAVLGECAGCGFHDRRAGAGALHWSLWHSTPVRPRRLARSFLLWKLVGLSALRRYAIRRTTIRHSQNLPNSQKKLTK